MNSKKQPVYTQETIDTLSQNPYTHSVTPYRITFTLEFKQFFMEHIHKPGMTSRKVLVLAGYDTSIISPAIVRKLAYKIVKEANSPGGLKPPKGASTEERAAAFARKDMSKQHVNTSIKELQTEVVRLKQQVEFLKKISQIDNLS